jgi:hypothetical protein
MDQSDLKDLLGLRCTYYHTLLLISLPHAISLFSISISFHVLNSSQ